MVKSKLLAIIGPGILIAGTGIGAGDLATAALAGSHLGVAVLWAVLVGALFKFVLNEGLTRWQLVTGETLLEGALRRSGRPGQWFFLSYFLIWSFLVATALMSACGVTTQAILPLFQDPVQGKIGYGMFLSLTGVGLVRLGGYPLFEKVMGVCIGLMVLTVVILALRLSPGWAAVVTGLCWPTIPEADGGQGLAWTVALMGGVGGTVTVLCYGYWIREEARLRIQELSLCRIDLATGYSVTALFGLAMVIIGSRIQVEGQGATLMVRLAARLEAELGGAAGWTFLLGAWCSVFTSLLGVWQSVPYLFADLWGMLGGRASPGQIVDTRARPYRWYLYALGVVPMIGLWAGFARMQQLYAIVGALFMPMLALALLLLNGRRRYMGESHRNRWPASAMLLLILLFFLTLAGWTVQEWLTG